MSRPAGAFLRWEGVFWERRGAGVFGLSGRGVCLNRDGRDLRMAGIHPENPFILGIPVQTLVGFWFGWRRKKTCEVLKTSQVWGWF